jgi:hypothetical protein
VRTDGRVKLEAKQWLDVFAIIQGVGTGRSKWFREIFRKQM